MSSTSLAETDRKARKAANTQGQPFRFGSKILAVLVNYAFDPTGDVVFVAEAAGQITGLKLSTNEVSTTLKEPRAPLTSLAFHAETNATDPFKSMRIFAGCWDKSIWRYVIRLAGDVPTGRSVTDKMSFPAHQDFVKCLLVARTPDKQDILISGGADGDLRFWSLDGRPLGFLKPDSRGVEDLVLDPLSSPDSPTVFFSTSKRDIYHFTLPDSTQLNSTGIKLSSPILAHETSVYRLHFDEDGDLWTASADKTVKQLCRNRNWEPDTTLLHPDFVRDVVTHESYGWVITACRDEQVRVWDKATGDLHHVFSGHFEEVTGLAVVGELVISVSIDATLRRWSLEPTALRKAVEAKNPQPPKQEPEPSSDMPMLTEEEEAELQALMEED